MIFQNSNECWQEFPIGKLRDLFCARESHCAQKQLQQQHSHLEHRAQPMTSNRAFKESFVLESHFFKSFMCAARALNECETTSQRVAWRARVDRRREQHVEAAL
jgi:hypothetical protein